MVDEITQDVDYSEENKQDLGEEIDSLSLKQLQKSNHDQYNYIQKLKKDCEYWQSKWLKLTLDNQVAEFDLKKARKAKATFSKENKALKEATSQLQISAKEQENQEIESNIPCLTHLSPSTRKLNFKISPWRVWKEGFGP